MTFTRLDITGKKGNYKLKILCRDKSDYKIHYDKDGFNTVVEALEFVAKKDFIQGKIKEVKIQNKLNELGDMVRCEKLTIDEALNDACQIGKLSMFGKLEADDVTIR